MTAPRTALIAGASGLVGRHCLDALLASPRYARVTAIARRPLAKAAPRLDVRLVAFDAIEADGRVDATDAFCALGTTLAAAGSREAFARVDRDHVSAFARLARAGGARRFVLVSSVGASPRSRNFYLRVKGEAEAAIAALGFEQADILRPGLLIGPRPESRPAEALAQRLMPLVGHVLVGRFRKYRAIPAIVVGRAMAGTALAEHAGVRVLEFDQLVSAASVVEEGGDPAGSRWSEEER